MKTFEPIAAQFKYNGFDFLLLKREGDVALFEKSKSHWSRKSYEVMIIQKLPAMTFQNGRSVPDREAMPPSESWGTKGWSYFDLKHAENRFSYATTSQTAHRNEKATSCRARPPKLRICGDCGAAFKTRMECWRHQDTVCPKRLKPDTAK